MSKNICIKFKQYDLLRLIPMSVGDDYDFKLEFMNNEFKLRLFPVDADYFDICESVNLKNFSITYHKKTEDYPAKFHLKSKGDSPKYFDFSIKNILDPSTSATFPIPLLRLKVNQNSDFKTFKRKSKNFNFDLEENNILEIYLVKSNFDLSQFIQKWSIFDLLYTVAPMGYFVHGKIKNISFINKYKSIYKNKSLKRKVVNISEGISLQFISYKNDHFYNESPISFIDIFENGEYLKYLFCAPINYYDSDGNKTPKIPASKIPAYKHQLNKADLNTEEKEMLRKRSVIYKGKLNDQGITPDGFSLEMG